MVNERNIRSRCHYLLPLIFVLDIFVFLYQFAINNVITQQKFTSPKSTIETLEKGVKYVQSQQ